MNFVELVHSILEDPSERKYFFEVRCPILLKSKPLHPVVIIQLANNVSAV